MNTPDWCDICETPQFVLANGEHACAWPPIDLDEIDARVKAATSWPWQLGAHGLLLFGPDAKGFDVVTPAWRQEDREFTVHARTDVPALSAALRGARTRIAELVDALKDAKAHLEWIGYGDRYERECAEDEGLAAKIDAALTEGV